MSLLNVNAFEIRQMVHAQPIVGTALGTLFGVLKSITRFNLGNEQAVATVWWPFVKKCFRDIVFYGFCAFYKRSRGGVVVPVHVPVEKCMITVDEQKGLQLAPKNTTEKVVPDRTRVFVVEDPDIEAQHLNSPFSRLLHQYRRLSELSTNYMEEEKRIAKPVNFLEDTGGARGTAVYQAVTAANPDWDAGVPGLTLSAKDTSDGHSQINEYITQLQGALVDKINRSSQDQEEAVDNLGIRRQEKRKRVQEVQIPLPPNKRLVQHMPSGRCDILRFEEHFTNLVPWSLGLPPSFMEARGGSVALNNDIMSSVVNGALLEHVENINELLRMVSSTLFGTMSEVINENMDVQLVVQGDGLELDDNNKSQKKE